MEKVCYPIIEYSLSRCRGSQDKHYCWLPTTKEVLQESCQANQFSIFRSANIASSRCRWAFRIDAYLEERDPRAGGKGTIFCYPDRTPTRMSPSKFKRCQKSQKSIGMFDRVLRPMASNTMARESSQWEWELIQVRPAFKALEALYKFCGANSRD